MIEDNSLIFRKNKYLWVKGHYICNLFSNSSEKKNLCVCGEREKENYNKLCKMLTFEESQRRMDGNSLYYFCNFSVSLYFKIQC